MDASVKGKVIRIGGFNAYPGVVEHEQHTAFIKSLCEHIGEGHWRVTFLESKTSKSVVIEKAR